MTTYSYEEALQASVAYFNGDELAGKVVVDKYLLRNSNNELIEKTPDDMHRRIAKEFARIEANKFAKPLTEDEIFSYLQGFKKIIPQGSPMYGIGNTDQYITLSNCYVLDPPEDSYTGIHWTDEQISHISKRRGGCGIDISKLRPNGSYTRNSSRTSTGIIPFMERFSNSIREVGQCVEGNQRVLTKKGLVKIKNVKIGDDVWTKEGWISVVNTIENPRKELYRVTTKSGYTITTSLDHLYQTFNNNGYLTETRLSDLKIGDSVVLCLGQDDTINKDNIIFDNENFDYSNSNNKPQNCILPSKLDERLAYLLGYSYGDGYVIHDEYGINGIEFACSNDYPNIKSKLNDIIKSLFDYETKFSDGDGDLENLSIYNKTIVKFLEFHKLLKEKSNKIVLPEKILSSSERIQKYFIAGYFDADGDAISTKGGYRFRSTNIDFLKEIQILLNTFGIASKISGQDRNKKGWQDLYSLAIVGKIAQERFVSHFTSLSEKVNLTGFSSKRDCWLSPFKAKSVGIAYNKYNYCPDNSQYLSQSVCNKLHKDGENVNTLLLQDDIINIELVKTEETFDIFLKSEHLFWCEGFYIHNSGRRGAMMMTISVHHPEVLEFATIKNNLTKVTGANISIRLTDEFLKAVVNGEEYEQRWPVEAAEIKIRKKVDARAVWKEIIKNAHSMAEPGLLFWDNIIRNSPADCYELFKTCSTNPCSELPLSALDSCRLLLINLYTYVKNPFTKDAFFDFDEFFHDAKIAQRLMDDLVDLEVECIDRILRKIESDPESAELKAREVSMFKRIRENCINGRRTGTGITALGDTLAALGIKYDSDAGLDTTEKIYMALKLGAYESSIEMAEELGPFPVWNNELEQDCEFFQRFHLDELYIKGRVVMGSELLLRMSKSGRRNIALLTSAPAGTVSILTQTTSGIEPLFMIFYFRKKKGNHNDEHFRVDYTDANGDQWMEFIVYHPKVLEWMRITGEKDITKSPWHGSCANDLDWKQRVYLQARANKHVDHAISSTLNLPKDVTVDKVAEIYETAWKADCKGITVYRDGCRDGVLTNESSKTTPKTEITERPKAVDCDIHHVTVKGKQYFVLVGKLEGKPYEVFAGKNGFLDKEHSSGIIIRQKKGFYKLMTADKKELLMAPITQASTEEEETVTRLASLLLQSNVDVHRLVQQLEKVNGELHGFARAVSRVMKKYVKDGTLEGELCPNCNSPLVRQEGCKTCRSCGWSACG